MDSDRKTSIDLLQLIQRRTSMICIRPFSADVVLNLASHGIHGANTIHEVMMITRRPIDT